MANIKVFQPKNEFSEEVKAYIEVQGEDPTDEVLKKWYQLVLQIEESQFPITDEDLLIDSVESMVNISSQKLKPFGVFDVITVKASDKNYRILMLEDEEYEIIE
ncbi:MAG: hypothetical protein ACI35O_04180 [Bacillaceae bacterium]